MRIVLLGAPGSGKRTQTMLMVERYGIPAISTGELLKAEVARASTFARQTPEGLEEKRPFNEELVLELIRARLQQRDAEQGFVLDGFPRNILQAITLDELLYEMGLPIELALLIDIETDVLMERLVGRRTCKSCGAQYNIYVKPTAVEGVCDLCGGGLRHRADDNEETISNRLHVYDHLVAPLIKHYARQEKLIRIDGAGTVDEVFARICEAVDSHEARAADSRAPDADPDAALQEAMATADSEPKQSDATVQRPSDSASGRTAAESGSRRKSKESPPESSTRLPKQATTAKKKIQSKKRPGRQQAQHPDAASDKPASKPKTTTQKKRPSAGRKKTAVAKSRTTLKKAPTQRLRAAEQALAGKTVAARASQAKKAATGTRSASSTPGNTSKKSAATKTRGKQQSAAKKAAKKASSKT